MKNYFNLIFHRKAMCHAQPHPELEAYYTDPRQSSGVLLSED